MNPDRQTDVRPSPLTLALPEIPGEISDGCFSSYPRKKEEEIKKYGQIKRPKCLNNHRWTESPQLYIRTHTLISQNKSMVVV